MRKPLTETFLYILVTLYSFLSFPILAQPDTVNSSSNSNYLETFGLIASDTRTPFWIQSNQFGIIPRNAPALGIRAGVQHTWQPKIDSNLRKWSFTIGSEITAFLGNSDNRVLLPQAFGAVQHGSLMLFFGRRRQWIGLGDSTLGSGSYAWSGNALPIPKIQIEVTQYEPLPFTNGWLSFKGFYSDGWFEKGRPITSHLKLHQKQLYLRLLKPGGKISVYGGFNHQVQWGGKSPFETVNGQMPKSFLDYLKVITGQASNGRLDSSATFFDNGNRIGNHLGSIDIALEIEKDNISWLLYRQNPYEDGSLFRLSSIRDGLNGVRVRFNTHETSRLQIKDVLFEMLYTKNQGGSQFIFNQAIFGRDNYFNHAQVRDGWSYNDRTIGTPFITPTSETKWKFPKFGNAFTSNNRVWLLHTGLSGTWGKYFWLTKLSYSSNAGVYDLEFPQTVHQFSGLLSIHAPIRWLNGSILKGSVASDIGGLYRKSYGLMLSLKKEGLFSF